MNSVYVLWKHFFPQKGLETGEGASIFGNVVFFLIQAYGWFVGLGWNLCPLACLDYQGGKPAYEKWTNGFHENAQICCHVTYLDGQKCSKQNTNIHLFFLSWANTQHKRLLMADKTFHFNSLRVPLNSLYCCFAPVPSQHSSHPWEQISH